MKHILPPCSRSSRRLAALGGLALAGLALTPTVRAEVLYWDSFGPDNGIVDGGTGFWDLTSPIWTHADGLLNLAWDNLAGATNVARFEANAGTVFLNQPVTAAGLSFGAAYSIDNSGYDLSLTGAGLTIFGNQVVTLSGAGNIILGGGQIWSNSVATLTIASPVNLNGHSLALETGNNFLDLTEVISGDGGLTIKATGTPTSAPNSGAPTLNNNNTYTGPTTMQGGYIWLNSGGLGALGADLSDIVLSNGGFRMTGNGTVTRGLVLAGNSGISKASGNTALNGRLTGTGNFNAAGNFGQGAVVILGASNDFTGDLVLGVDITVRPTNTHALSLADVNTTYGARSWLDLTNANLSYVLGGLKGTNILHLGTGLGEGGSGEVLVGNNGRSNPYSGPLSGAAGFTKIGAGPQTLLGANLHTGKTTVSAGVLRLGVPTQSLDFTLGGTTTAQRRILTNLVSTADLYPGQFLTGASIPANTFIVSVDSPVRVSVNNALTAGTTSATFAGRAGSLTASPNVIVAAGAILDVQHVTDYSVCPGQALGGGGTVLGNVIVGNNAAVSPGASVGILTQTGSQSWLGGGTLKWELSGTGAGQQDTLLASGTLAIQANSGDKFRINVTSLDGAGLPGPLAGGFNPAVDQSWKMVTASGGITGFSADAFTFVDNFTAWNGGSGTFEVAQTGNDLFLVYKAAFVPEPPVAGSPVPAAATVWLGESAQFIVTASGTAPLGYQWRHNGMPLADATTSALRLTNLQTDQSGNYDCIVSSPYPPASTSSVAVLTVNRLVTNGWYRLGEAGTGENNRPTDSSGWGHDFLTELDGASVMLSSASPPPGSSQYYDFGGTSGFADIGWNPPEDDVGVECWVRVGDLTQTAQIFGSGTSGLNGLNLQAVPGTGLRAVISTSGFDTTVGTPYLTASAAQWVHVAVVRQSGVTRFYVNGLPAGPSATGGPADATAPFLGRANTGRTFTGAIDEARIFTFAPGQFQLGDLGFYQGVPPGQLHPQPWFNPTASATFYQNARAFVSYSGWWDLWYRYRGALPYGQGVTAAQVENNVPDTAAFPDKVFTLDPPDAVPAGDGHAETVGRLFYGGTYYEDSNTIFEYGFGRRVNDIAAYTTDAFRENVLAIVPFNQRNGSLPAWNHGRREVLNLSNSLGNGGEDNTIRALDYLIDAANVLAFSSMPGSYIGENNETLAGNLWNALVIAQNGPRDANWNGAAHEKVGTNFRVKPDLVSSDYIGGRTGGASSWTTPTVAGAAAFLLEAAHRTPASHAATNNYVMKSVLLAGASKQGLVSPVWTGDNIVDWDLFTPYTYSNHPPSQPLDRLFGAGLFNLNNAWTILAAGEQSRTVTNAAFGWARGTGLTASTAHTYWFALRAAQREFVALLAWNRHIQDNAGTSYTWSVANLKLELYDAANQLLASSDDPGNNIEQVYLAQGLAAGLYCLKVTSPGATPENYGLAWRGVAPTAVAEPVAVLPQFDGTVKVVCQGVPLAPYKLFRCMDLTWNFWEEVGAGTSDANGVVEMTDPFPPSDKAFYRAQFTY